MLKLLKSNRWHCHSKTMSHTTKCLLASLMLLSYSILMINSHHVGQSQREQHQRPQLTNKDQTRQASNEVSPMTTTITTTTTKEISCDESSPIDCQQALTSMNQTSFADKQQPTTAKEEPQYISVSSTTSSDQYALHFGAKLSIFLLSATILLVALATLVDIHLSDGQQQQHQQSKRRHFLQRRSSKHNYTRYSSRDHRSLSLSSSCSSSLFCSANSIASSSAPILATNQQHLSGIRCKQRPQVTANHYESNLQLHFNQDTQQHPTNTGEGHHNQVMLCDDGSVSRTTVEHPDHHHLTDTSNIYSQWHRLENERWANSTSSPPPPPSSIQADDNSGRLSSLKSVSKQLLLAFSLRHSARQIFLVETTPQAAAAKSTGETPQRSTTSGRSTNSPCLASVLVAGSVSCHRSRVSSLSSINEQQSATDFDSETSSSLESASCCPRCGGSLIIINQQSDIDTNQDQADTNTSKSNNTAKESIDSLHGLRFLSMIWVIVIHSYDFAMRWMMFTNRSTIDGIYTTIASQLLANGSFACDSFFFAGGFLLPYLAFQKHQNKSSQQDGESKQTNNNQQLAREATSYCGKQSNGKISPPRSVCSSPAPAIEQSAERQQQPVACSCHLLSSRHQIVVVGPHLILNNSNFGPQQGGESAKLNTNEPAKKAKNKRIPSMPSVLNQQVKQQELTEAKNKNTTKPATMNANKTTTSNSSDQLTFNQVLVNILHRYVRMMPLMMAIIGLSATLLRYLGEGVAWQKSTVMYDDWCRKNWWVNLLFLHNFVNRENMCLSHSWYSAVDIQLFLVGQLIMFVLFKSRRMGLLLLFTCLFGSQLITAILTLLHHLPAVPLVSSVDEQTMNLYYGIIYIKPYCRASPYLIGILLAYLMRTTSLGQLKLKQWQVLLGWTVSLGLFAFILLCMQPAMNGHSPSELQSAAYSSLSRPLWACATGWMIFACMTNQGGPIESFLSARCFIPFSRLTYPAFLIHPIVMAIFYGSRESSFHFSHYLMLYLILGNIVITYACAFVLAALFELPLLSVERVIKRQFFTNNHIKRHYESSLAR